MDENKPSEYIEKIVLEILDRHRFWYQKRRNRKIEKFNIARFNAREAAYAFLRKYDGQSFVKTQKIKIWYNNQELHLCVRNLIYGKIDKASNSTVEFIYRPAIFSEIKWPVITINKTSRVRWATDHYESTSDAIQPLRTDGDYSSINVDEPVNVDTRVVPSTSCNNLDDDQSLSVNSGLENIIHSFSRECQVRRSVTDLQKLINHDKENVTSECDTDNENLFRSSIHILVNQNIN